MSHDTHHHDASHAENKPRTALRSSFWFVLILVLLFVSAVNFIDVMGKEEGEGHGGHETEEMHSGNSESPKGTEMHTPDTRQREEPTEGAKTDVPNPQPAAGTPSESHSADEVLPSDSATH